METLRNTIKSRIRDLKIEYNLMTGEKAGDKPYQYNDKFTKDQNIYIAGILGAFVVYQTILKEIEKMDELDGDEPLYEEDEPKVSGGVHYEDDPLEHRKMEDLED